MLAQSKRLHNPVDIFSFNFVIKQLCRNRLEVHFFNEAD